MPLLSMDVADRLICVTLQTWHSASFHFCDNAKIPLLLRLLTDKSISVVLTKAFVVSNSPKYKQLLSVISTSIYFL